MGLPFFQKGKGLGLYNIFMLKSCFDLKVFGEKCDEGSKRINQSQPDEFR